MNDEIWKDIKGWENLYQVSNYGRVRSLDREVVQNNNGTEVTMKYKGKILKPSVSSQGYVRVVLQNKDYKINYSVHRLVAQAFLPNSNNLEEVNHIDENSLNNNVNNLEWCSHKYNINYGNRNKKVSAKLTNKPKTEEHKKKLSFMAKQRKIIRDKKGRIITILGNKAINKRKGE